MDKIHLMPFISSPRGIEVCFTRNEGRIEQRRFPSGTTRDAIIAELQGNPLPPVDPDKIAETRESEQKERRAAVSQPVNTASEEDLKKSDAKQEDKINELNLIRAALKEAGVKGFQLLKEETLRKKYAELLKKKAAEKE